MIINRHNYEEYFILYMDNELGHEDRRQVEEFVQKNPDLKEELDILLQYKLVPDTNIVFEHKEELMVHDDNPLMNPGNYEEWLVLYIDHELNNKQRILVEEFIANHPSAKDELAILQRTKLQPEPIIFADKESLFRREEKVRAIPMRWWRIAAAAVLILAAGLTAVVVLNKGSAGKEGIAKTPGNKQKTNSQNNVVTNLPAGQNRKEENKPVSPAVIPNTIQRNVASVSRPTNNSSTAKHNAVINKKPNNNSSIKETKEEPVLVDNKPSNNLPQPIDPTRITADASNNHVASVKTFTKETKPQVQDLIKNNPVTSNTTQPLYANNSTGGDDALNQSGSKRSKLRGFLRKVTRTFEKNTNMSDSDDDRLLVGGLAIKL
jgi:hypothetical protein